MRTSPLRGLVFALGCTTVAFALSACDSSARPAETPAPQQIYIVTAKTVDGKDIMSERVVDYTYTDGGCVRYKTPEDQARNVPKWRVVCNTPVFVKPEEK